METLTIVRQNNYWGRGKDLKEAKANFKKASGRTATNSAEVRSYIGSAKDLDLVTIDDIDGTIRGPASITRLNPVKS